MQVALSTALLLASPPAEAQAHLLSGDFYGYGRLRAEHLDRGRRVDRGAWGHLEDLAALLRCRPLPPGPSDTEPPEMRAIRTVLRLEAARLERFLHGEDHAQTDLQVLVKASVNLRFGPEPNPMGQVRWPLEDERWPGEKLDPVVAPARCQRRKKAGRTDRLRLERRRISEAAGAIEHLPRPLVGRVAWAYLSIDGQARFKVPEVWLKRILNAVRPLRDPFARRARLLAALKLLDEGGTDNLKADFEALVKEPELATAARVGWVRSLGRRWPEIERAARASDAAPPAIRAWFDHSRARALVALGDFDRLDRFAKRLVPRATALDERTLDLLLEAQLARPPSEALAMAALLGPEGPAQVRNRWWSLGRRALDAGEVELARSIFDRLWDETGPDDLSEILSVRAEVALAGRDGAGFVDLVDLLVLFIVDRPSARSRRSFYRLVQQSVARWATERPEDIAQLAAALLKGAQRLREAGARPDRRMTSVEPILVRWAGGSARGARPPRPSRDPPRPTTRLLGQIFVPRIPPSLPPPALSIPDRTIPSFFVWTSTSEVLKVGIPPGIRQLAEAE